MNTTTHENKKNDKNLKFILKNNINFLFDFIGYNTFQNNSTTGLIQHFQKGDRPVESKILW